MEKAALVEKTRDALRPFETANVVDFVKHLTVKSAITNPWFVTVFLILAFYAIIKRSKFVLSVLFTACALLLLIHYTLPTDSEGLTLSSTLPFAFGGLAIGAVLIYLYFIKTE
ncbi:hypothetical protein [Geomesophilobacter sediminis]|uniref:Uncharacterized protein n=1 Tax=Geomesophilobacter sediminis TaxID=2798584 RepID=A0A8J7J7Q3_9BACT|nr:hypothetical protein [Geomesophilobacter sediminis]MBJ6725396.1 hypothetical protein [Geomesophilobacter sediminis]